jgi:hypothetical protein
MLVQPGRQPEPVATIIVRPLQPTLRANIGSGLVAEFQRQPNPRGNPVGLHNTRVETSHAWRLSAGSAVPDFGTFSADLEQ